MRYSVALELELWGREAPELGRTRFTHPLLSHPHATVRGKCQGAFPDHGSFEWSRAVRALVLLLLRTRFQENGPPHLEGYAGSAAASLDYALDKQPAWMVAMFGTDATGTTLLRRMVLRSNPGRRRPGPVSLALNRHFLPPEAVVIRWEGAEIRDGAGVWGLVGRGKVGTCSVS